MFWISAANTWCSKYRNKALEKRIKTGVHSPGMFRSLYFLTKNQNNNTNELLRPKPQLESRNLTLSK